MSFANSKYQEDYQGALEAIREFGVSGIKMSRIPDRTGNTPPDLSASPLAPVAQAYEFSGVILPINKNEASSEETTEELYGKSRALLCRSDTADAEDGYEFVKPKDLFSVNGKEYQVISIQEINPDGQFAVIFDCIVSGK